MTPTFSVTGVLGIGEVAAGDDVAELIAAAVGSDGLRDGDIVAVSSKIVSKAEGRTLEGVDRDAAIDAETQRTITEWTTARGRSRVVETKHGLVMAAAGVDASNVKPGSVLLLPVDPDASARAIRASLRRLTDARVGVIVTDTAGRAWRQGVTDMAIGAAGVQVIDDYRGQTDSYGNELGVTTVAVADEIAAASELVRAKLSGVPVAIVRGLEQHVLPEDDDGPGAAALVRSPSEDRFRLGTPEAMRAAVTSRRTVTSFTSEPVDPEIVDRALAAAQTAPMFDGTPVQFDVIDSAQARAEIAAHFDGPETALVLSAPVVLVPRSDGSPLGVGAAVENLLVTLAADGIGSAWLPPPDVDAPQNGAIVAGHPAA